MEGLGGGLLTIAEKSPAKKSSSCVDKLEDLK